MEQHSALSKSSGMLDGMRKRFGTPTPGASGGDQLSTPRANLAAPFGLAPATQQASNPGLSMAPAASDTPRSQLSSGGSLKENLGAEMNRSTVFGGTAAPNPAPTPGTSFAAAAAAALSAGALNGGAFGSLSGGGGGGDSMLQQASNLFLQQVEDMRRKYTAEVERLKAEVEGLAGQRDSLTSEVHSTGASAKALKVQVTASQRELEAVTADLQRAQSRLQSLEAAQRAEQDRYQKDRAAAAATAEREAAAQRQRLAAEREAAAAAVRKGEEALARQAAALEARAARMEEQGRSLVDRDAGLAGKEREFEGQVRAELVPVAVCLRLCGIGRGSACCAVASTWRLSVQLTPTSLLANPRHFNTSANMQCFLHVHAHPCCLLQVKDITRSLKEREAQVTEAERVAASHLQREKRLIQLESSVLEREQALERQLAEAAAGRAELESQQARQRQEAARLEEAGRSLTRNREEAAARLEEREAALAAREQDLAAAMQRFGEERLRQAAADEQQRQQTLAELQRLDAGISEAMGQLRQAEEEAEAMRRRVGEVQREAGEAEAARDTALQAHKAAQQAAQSAQSAMDAALATGNEELEKVREGWAGWWRHWHWYRRALAVRSGCVWVDLGGVAAPKACCRACCSHLSTSLFTGQWPPHQPCMLAWEGLLLHTLALPCALYGTVP